MADPNCGTCGGTGQVERVTLGESGLMRRGKAPCPAC